MQYFHSFLGVICVSAHFAYQLKNTAIKVKEFLKKLSLELIFNDFNGELEIPRNSSMLNMSMEVT